MKIFRKGLILIICLPLLLAACTGHRQRYDRVLQRAHEQNQSYDSITNVDSLRLAADYFDRHGTPNDRMRAHYLLGCAYRDMGDSPRALEAYHDAVDRADTTSADCDYALLARVHAQMAELFYYQHLPYEVLSETNNQYRYAILANDTSVAINAVGQRVGAYDLLNNPDSIIEISTMVSNSYRKAGLKEKAAMALAPTIVFLIERGQLMEAKKAIDLYDSESGVVHDGFVENRLATYYYMKGRYYLAINKIDSAKILFYRLLPSEFSHAQNEAGCRGLYLLYKQQNQKDSIVKYADMCYHLMDLSVSTSASDNIQRMHELYNYEHFRHETQQAKNAATQNRLFLLISLILLFFFIVVVVLVSRQYRQKKKHETQSLLSRYAHVLQMKEQAENDLKNLQELLSEKEQAEKNAYRQLLQEKNAVISKLMDSIEEYKGLLENNEKKVSEQELFSTEIYILFKQSLTDPEIKIGRREWSRLRSMMNEKMPRFYSLMNSNNRRLSPQDYDICILVRLCFSPKEIAILTNNTPSNISNKRNRLLHRIFQTDGKPEDFDRLVQSIK